MAFVYTSIGTNSSITTATPTSCSSTGSGYAVTFSYAPSGVNIGDKVTMVDEGSYYATFTYRVTAISSSTLTFVYVEDDMWTGDTSPCDLLDSMWEQAECAFGRFYNSPGEWANDLGSSDVYASGDGAVGECHNDSSAAWTSSSHFVSVSSLGSLASIKLTVHPDSRHGGRAGTGGGARIVHDGSSTLTPIVIGCNNFTLEWLRISGLDATEGTTGVEISATATLNVLVQNMIIEDINPDDDDDTTRYGIKIVGSQASSIPSGSYGRTIRNNFVTRISASTPASANATGIGQSDSTSDGGANCYHNSVSVSSSGGTTYAFFLSPDCVIVNNLAYSGSFKITDDSSGSSLSKNNFSQGSSSASLGSGPGYGARDSSDGESMTSYTDPTLKLRATSYTPHWTGTTPPTTQPHGYYNACVEAGANGYATNVDIFGSSWEELWDIGCAAAVVTILKPGPATCIASTQGEYQSAATAEAVTVSPPTISISYAPITPSAATTDAVTVNPTVTLGSFSITPSAATADAGSVNPTVTLDSFSYTPSTATSDAVTVNPTVTLGSLSITPSTATAEAVTVDPAVLGIPIVVTPNAATAESVTVNPTVTLDSFTVTPNVATADASSSGGSVTLDSFSVTPSAGTAEAQTSSNFGVKLSGFIATSEATTTGGAIILSGFTATADAGTAVGDIIETLTPSAATADTGTVAPTVILGSVSITPNAATADTSSSTGTITLGSLSLTPSEATADAGSVAPTIGQSDLTVTPATATAEIGTVAPTTVLSSLSITPTPVTVNISVTQGIILVPASSKAFTPAPTVILGGFTIVTPLAATASTGASTGTFGYSSITVIPTIITSDADTTAPGVIQASLSVIPAVSTGDAATTDPTVIIGPPVVVSTNPATASTRAFIPTIVPSAATATARTIIEGVISDKIIFSKSPSLLKPTATNEILTFAQGDVLRLTKSALTTETMDIEN